MTSHIDNLSLTTDCFIDIIPSMIESNTHFEHAKIVMKFPFAFQYENQKFRGICEVEKDCGSNQLYTTNIEWYEKPNFEDTKFEFDVLESSESYLGFDINKTIQTYVEEEICYILDPKNGIHFDFSKEIPEWSKLKIIVENEEYALTNWVISIPLSVDISNIRYHALIIIYYDILEENPTLRYKVVPNGLDSKEIRMSNSLDKLAQSEAQQFMSILTGVPSDTLQRMDGRTVGRILLNYIKSGERRFAPLENTSQKQSSKK